MELKPIDTPELLALVASWLSEKRNYQWLDFGSGAQGLSATVLKIMLQKDTHVLRVFTSEDGVPIGVVGLSHVNRAFKTASFWGVLGDKRYIMRGYPRRAAVKMLNVGFRELGLEAINTWTVECNHASLRIIEQFNYRPIGRRRQCHYIDGRPYDRLWFDMLACEHGEIEDA